MAIKPTVIVIGKPIENKFIAGADFAGVAGRVTTKDGTYNPDDETGHGTALAGVAQAARLVDQVSKTGSYPLEFLEPAPPSRPQPLPGP